MKRKCDDCGDTRALTVTVYSKNGPVIGTYCSDCAPVHMVPEDWPVRELGPDDPATDRDTCGTCGRSWDDAISTSMTPTPSGRCPFESFH